MITHLRVTHTRDRFGRPLAVLENLPGEGLELSAAQLHSLGEALILAAVDCKLDARRGGLAARPVRRTYALCKGA